MALHSDVRSLKKSPFAAQSILFQLSRAIDMPCLRLTGIGKRVKALMTYV